MAITAGISKVVLNVANVFESARFYSEVMGLERDPEAPDERWGWAWFCTGEPGSEQRLGLHQGRMAYEDYSPTPAGPRHRTVHFALHIPHKNLDELVERLRSKGIDLHGPASHDWVRAVSYYLFDLDGNLIELFSPLG
jgi:catechol-2,3-dioxygenase